MTMNKKSRQVAIEDSLKRGRKHADFVLQRTPDAVPPLSPVHTGDSDIFRGVSERHIGRN